MSLNGIAAIRDIDEYIRSHQKRHESLSSQERHDLEIVRRDAIHSILQQHDAWLFSEFDRLKLVELEYLYQVRGVRQVMPSAIFREGYEGYGNSWTGSKIRLLYPQDRKRGGRESREPFLPINKILETKDLTEQLVPLRINLNTEKYRLADRILWNVDDTTIPLELFVENVLEDYGLPLTLAPDVCKSLQEQISSHVPHIYPHPPEKKPDSEPKITEHYDVQIGDETAKFSATSKATSPVPASTVALNESKEPETNQGTDRSNESSENRKKDEDENTKMAADASEDVEMKDYADKATAAEEPIIKKENGDGISTEHEAAIEKPLNERSGAPIAGASDSRTALTSEPAETIGAAETSKHAESTAPGESRPTSSTDEFDEDLRITIKLNITIGQHQLVDQFEWDINNPDNDPEMFGLTLANELSLPLEFSTAISHSIREQCQSYSRALFSSGYQFDGKPPLDQQLQNETAMPVGETSFLRRPELLPLFSPSLNEAKIPSLDNEEQETERREIRSRRRQGRSSRRNHHHDIRSANTSAAGGNDAVSFAQDQRGPDFCTPVYSSILPGGLDRNLSILHMTACHNDENYGGEKQDLVYYFTKHRREHKIQSASQFSDNMMKINKPRWIVKLKLPRQQAPM